MSSRAPLEKRLRLAGVFVLLGLVVEVAALRWVHPNAFWSLPLLESRLLRSEF
jgi:hypothetical protein